MNYQICVVSDDSELVQLIRSSLTSSSTDLRPQPSFHIVQSPAAELTNLAENGSFQALLLDLRGSAALSVPGEKGHLNIPVISLTDSPADGPFYPEETGERIVISLDDINNPLFPTLLTQAIARFEVSKKLERVQKRLNKKIKDLQSIRQASLRITENLSLVQVLDKILEIASDITGADDTVLFLYEEGVYDQGLVWDFDGDLTSNHPRATPKDNLYIVNKGGQIERAKDFNPHPGFLYPDFKGSIYDIDLTVNNIIIGSLTIGFREGHHFTGDEKRILQMLTDQAAIAIENARLYKIVSAMAVIQERNRLARDLHDSIAQALYGIILFAKASLREAVKSEDEFYAEHLETIQNTALEALREMRLLLYELRPAQLEREGLIPALSARLESVEERSGLKVDFNIEGTLVLPQEVEDAFYLITQEALNNSLKHAQASQVTLRIKNTSSGIKLLVQDNGVGFDLAQLTYNRGLGISAMKERAELIGGKFSIESNPDNGTTIQVEVAHE